MEHQAGNGQKRVKGKVKWFNAARGYGFVVPDEGGPDIFVHFRSIQAGQGEYRKLEEGQRVEFEFAHGPKGPKADNVVPIS